MEFEYNGHLNEEDRTNLVANEIVNKYPQINLQIAKEAALFEGKISTDKNLNMELQRLYNIMLVNQTNKRSNIIVFKDYLEILRANVNSDINDIYYDIVNQIKRYFDSDAVFPIISYR